MSVCQADIIIIVVRIENIQLYRVFVVNASGFVGWLAHVVFVQLEMWLLFVFTWF